ncbi:MAG: hypothetical protein BWZ00_00709 [Bacteroidetes bacterium ADurb.BinA174]|nr:MAG: hypothetical protein BWZ00_00709 [Bacteroidetes bacterium ADurb.BinA174]
MKKLALFTIISFCLFTNLYAQKLRFGIQGSGGMATAATTNREKEFSEIETVYLGISKIHPVFSYGFNIYAGYAINEDWGVAIEPGFIRKGFAKKVDINNNIEKLQTRLNYFQIPILAEVFFSENITLTLGPELSYLLDAKEVIEKQSTDVLKQYNKNKLDVALQVGLYYTFNKHFDIGIKSGVSATRLGKFAILNSENEVVVEYDRRNAYGHVFLRVKL